MKHNKKGFTLIELLVVIAIIGLLSTLAVVALNNARTKARDARRVSDIKQIQTALELFFNDCNTYSTGDIIALGDITGDNANHGCVPDVGTVYMAVVPNNPTPNGATYTYTGAPATYSLTYSLEATTGGIGSGAHTATPAGMVDE